MSGNGIVRDHAHAATNRQRTASRSITTPDTIRTRDHARAWCSHIGAHLMQHTITTQYQARQDRQEHPDGTFDNAGRWYPSDTEYRACCDHIRRPSRAWPYTLMQHCRTKKHITQLHADA